MLSNNDKKLIRSLAQGKYRRRHRLFIAEGMKVVSTIAQRYAPLRLFVTETTDCSQFSIEPDIIDERQLTTISSLQHPQGVLALFPLPEETEAVFAPQLCLALDAVQDPGNLGTIIRVADWFGIRHIVCSHDTADAYAPKVVQATMGSVAHVDVHYVDLPQWLHANQHTMPVAVTSLRGTNIYDAQLPSHAIIVMGNEGNGVSEAVMQQASMQLRIPSYSSNSDGAESLNVAMATAIVCAEWRRQHS